MFTGNGGLLTVITVLALAISVSDARAAGAQDILKEGLLGAATGALSSEMSGGKAGKGALIGAGTNVIGGALLDVLTSSTAAGQPVYYAQQQSYAQAVYTPQPVYVSQPVVYDAQPVTYYAQPVYASVPQTDSNKQILKQGLMGAATGALSSEMSGGKAGQGALIGAGTNVIGGALLDTLMTPASSQAPVYAYGQTTAPRTPAYQNTQIYQSGPLKKHIYRKFDSSGKLISEEEVWE